MCVDATYRSDLAELKEVNFARFDAKEERFVDLEAEDRQVKVPPSSR